MKSTDPPFYAFIHFTEDINMIFSVKPLIASLYKPFKNNIDCVIGVIG